MNDDIRKALHEACDVSQERFDRDETGNYFCTKGDLLYFDSHITIVARLTKALEVAIEQRDIYLFSIDRFEEDEIQRAHSKLNAKIIAALKAGT